MVTHTQYTVLNLILRMEKKIIILKTRTFLVKVVNHSYIHVMRIHKNLMLI